MIAYELGNYLVPEPEYSYYASIFRHMNFLFIDDLNSPQLPNDV